MKFPATKVRKLVEKIEAVKQRLEEIRDECREKYDEKPERWRESDPGLEYLDQLGIFEQAIDYLEKSTDEIIGWEV